MFQIKFFFPNCKIFNSNWSECRELWSFEYFYLFSSLNFLFFSCFSFNKILMNPISSFLYNIKDNRLMMTVENKIINFLGNSIDVIPSDPRNRLDFILQSSEWVLLGVFEHNVDLILELISLVGLAKYIELKRGSFFDDLEFI